MMLHNKADIILFALITLCLAVAFVCLELILLDKYLPVRIDIDILFRDLVVLNFLCGFGFSILMDKCYTIAMRRRHRACDPSQVVYSRVVYSEEDMREAIRELGRLYGLTFERQAKVSVKAVRRTKKVAKKEGARDEGKGDWELIDTA